MKRFNFQIPEASSRVLTVPMAGYDSRAYEAVLKKPWAPRETAAACKSQDLTTIIAPYLSDSDSAVRRPQKRLPRQ
ncbi:hypothetical protein E4U17_003946 [Claviceps sp. LM77 group G4]|nr:hypothetical protein E4U17_003946 [Claviceps sp. LM77 group G4]